MSGEGIRIEATGSLPRDVRISVNGQPLRVYSMELRMGVGEYTTAVLKVPVQSVDISGLDHGRIIVEHHSEPIPVTVRFN